MAGKEQAVAKDRQIPLGTYPSGARSFGPWAFPNGLDGFDIRVGRCTHADPTIWPNASTIITLDLEFSFDGGLTYPNAQQASNTGGIKTGRDGDIPEEIWTWRFSPNQPTNARATLTVTNGPVKTYLDLSVL